MARHCSLVGYGLALLGLAVSSLCGGCTVHFSIRATQTLNLQERPGAEKPISDLMPFSILQIKYIEPEQRREFIEQINWQKFHDNWDTYRETGQFPDPLAGYLTVPGKILTRERPLESFDIGPGEHKPDVAISRRWGTRHFLVITRGARKAPGGRSFLLLTPPLHVTEIELCFSGDEVREIEPESNDVCVDKERKVQR